MVRERRKSVKQRIRGVYLNPQQSKKERKSEQSFNEDKGISGQTDVLYNQSQINSSQ